MSLNNPASRLLALVAALTMLAAACGGDDPPTLEEAIASGDADAIVEAITEGDSVSIDDLIDEDEFDDLVDDFVEGSSALAEGDTDAGVSGTIEVNGGETTFVIGNGELSVALENGTIITVPGTCDIWIEAGQSGYNFNTDDGDTYLSFLAQPDGSIEAFGSHYDGETTVSLTPESGDYFSPDSFQGTGSAIINGQETVTMTWSGTCA